MNDISVSEIQIVPVKPNNGLVAFASFVVNNSLYLGNIAIYTSPSSTNGFRLVYPAKSLPNGKEINCVHPINRGTGAAITAALIDKYENLTRRGKT